MSTEDLAPTSLLRHMNEHHTVELGGVPLAAGVTLRLMSGDYFYETEWTTPRPLSLLLTWAGETMSVDGSEYVYVEGFEVDVDPPRPRAVAVRIAALGRATAR